MGGKCYACHRGAPEVQREHGDIYAMLCRGCSEASDRQWQPGEQATVAPGHVRAGQVVTVSTRQDDGKLWIHVGPDAEETIKPHWLRPVPTLAEWMGGELANLPPEWRAVLREQPVPAGCIDTWTWRMSSGGEWRLHGRGTRSGTAIVSLAPVEVVRAINGDDDPWLDVDTAQMALFTRHPGVKPTPRNVEIWAPYEQQGDDI